MHVLCSTISGEIIVGRRSENPISSGIPLDLSPLSPLSFYIFFSGGYLRARLGSLSIRVVDLLLYFEVHVEFLEEILQNPYHPHI